MEYNNMNEEKYLKMIKELERKNKIIWKAMHAIMFVSLISLILGVLTVAFLIPEGIWQFIAILGILILFLIPCFYALKLEISVGVYQCKKCGHEFVPKYSEALLSMHMGTTRYLKCPKCNKKTWCKKNIK